MRGYPSRIRKGLMDMLDAAIRAKQAERPGSDTPAARLSAAEEVWQSLTPRTRVGYLMVLYRELSKDVDDVVRCIGEEAGRA